MSKQLGTKHVPIHLLCKSYTCEKLDESCINVLVKIEQQLKMAEMITNRTPNLCSFIRQSKSVVLCATTALLKLVSHEERAKPTSLAKNFDIILEEDDVTKSFSLYKERRFTKLGYTAGSIIDGIPQFEKLLSETTYNNSLVQACRLYLENDYILAALKALSYFTYKVTMPYLNCVKKCDENDLTDILPRLYRDLANGSLEALEDYKVEWTHVQADKHSPSSELDKYLLLEMCKQAAEGVKMQCGREYFPEDDREPRAAQLYKMSIEERKNIPT